MPKLLYVSELSSDCVYGRTTDEQIIERNRMLLDPTLKKLKGFEILPAGRYVCIISINKDATQNGMMFFDFKQNIDFALHVSKEFENDLVRETLLNVFHHVSNNYKENYNEVELVHDKSFLGGIPAN